VGAVNFITGAGGFLQIFLFGYSGLRLHAEHLSFKGQYGLPPDCSFLYLHKIKYLGSEISFNFTKNYITIQIHSVGSVELELLGLKNQVYDLKGKFLK
jgi:hypothetical protein